MYLFQPNEIKHLRLDYVTKTDQTSIGLIAIQLSCKINQQTFKQTIPFGTNIWYNKAKENIEIIRATKGAWQNIETTIQNFLVTVINPNSTQIDRKRKLAILRGLDEFLRCLIRAYAAYIVKERKME